MKRIASILITAAILLATGARGADLVVSPASFSITGTVGQAIGASVFQVANTGAAVIAYTMTATNLDGGLLWLSVNPTSGNLTPGNSNSVLILYTNTAGLAAGRHTGRVDVVETAGATQSVFVSLQLNNKPVVAWDAANSGTIWTNQIVAGGALGNATVQVWNASAAPAALMNYTVSVLDDPFGWVSVSNASGTSTGNHGTVYVTYPSQVVSHLASGIYTATLKAEGVDAATGLPATNGALLIILQLTVKGSPVLKVSATQFSETVLENYSFTNSFIISNEGTIPRGDMPYTLTTDASWITVSPATGVVTESATIQVGWNLSLGLSPGTYTGHITVNAAGTNQSIALTLTVTPRTPLNLELPTVAGIMYIGQTVNANAGLWQNQTRLTYAYQWERAANKAGSGLEVLSGAVGTSYIIQTADRGKYLRVKVTATDSAPFPRSSTVNSAWVNAAKVKALRADFNGDGITDLWFYDVFRGTWYASFGENSSAVGVFPGIRGLIAVPGDFDGDGYEDLGAYDPAHGMWHILYLPRSEYVFGSLFGGTPEEAGATPVAMDFDGDGATDIGLYFMGYWAILYSSLERVVVVPPFAALEGEPVTGDWDGDGIAEMGIYNNGIWTLRMNDGSVLEQEYGGGGPSVLPAPADYDADGATDLAVYDTGANQWRWRESRTGFEQSVSFGTGGTMAIPGYYDHDSLSDWAQVHLSSDFDFIVWEVKRTTETIFPYRGQSFQQSTGRWRVSW